MTLPRPLVFAALVAAYVVGQMLVLIDQQESTVAAGKTDLIDKTVINQRLA